MVFESDGKGIEKVGYEEIRDAESINAFKTYAQNSWVLQV